MNMAWVVENHPTFLGCPANVPNGGDPNIIQMLSSSLGKPMGWGSPVSFGDPLQMPQPITHLWWRLVAELRLVNGDFSSLARKIHPLQTVLQLSFNLDLSILNTTFHVFTVSFPIFNCKNMQFPQVSDVFLYHNCKSKNDCTPVGLPKHTVHSVVCSVTVRWRIFPWCISTCCLVFNHHCIVQVKEG